jgi:hypothetical protein
LAVKKACWLRAGVFTCILGNACSEDDARKTDASTASAPPDAAAGQAPDGSAICPFPATECPIGCIKVDAFALDEARQCTQPVTLGCRPEGRSTTDGPCFKRIEDGLLVSVPSSDMYGRAGWIRCSFEDQHRIAVSPCAP